jgi:hypothetical protein
MIGEGIKSTNQRKHSYVQDHVEVGFFTDPSVCIGCKACEVACKEWNQVPDDGFTWSGNSYDNTGHLGASTWRHVMFLEQDRQKGNQITGPWVCPNPQSDLSAVAAAKAEDPFRWVFLSDVCKHCEEAGCPRSVPDRVDCSDRGRFGVGARRRLQWLRLLRRLVSIRRDRSSTRAAAQRRRRIQVHLLLRSTKERPHTGLREGLSNRIDRLRTTR